MPATVAIREVSKWVFLEQNDGVRRRYKDKYGRRLVQNCRVVLVLVVVVRKVTSRGMMKESTKVGSRILSRRTLEEQLASGPARSQRTAGRHGNFMAARR